MGNHGVQRPDLRRQGLLSLKRPRVGAGFTFIEMMVSLAVLALLASATVPVARVAVQRQKEQSLRLALREIRLALDAHRDAAAQGAIAVPAGGSGYPRSLDVLAAGVPDLRRPDGQRLVFLRRVPRDPFADGALPAAATWRLRAYASDPEHPREGDDVYDVMPTAVGVGLNGVPYRAW